MCLLPSPITKGAYGCAVALQMGEETDSYVAYCLQRVQLLLHHGVKPVMVFDGASLPMKAPESEARALQRQQRQQAGQRAWKLNRKEEAEAIFQTCIEVTLDMAAALIQALRRCNIGTVPALVTTARPKISKKEKARKKHPSRTLVFRSFLVFCAHHHPTLAACCFCLCWSRPDVEDLIGPFCSVDQYSSLFMGFFPDVAHFT